MTYIRGPAIGIYVVILSLYLWCCLITWLRTHLYINIIGVASVLTYNVWVQHWTLASERNLSPPARRPATTATLTLPLPEPPCTAASCRLTPPLPSTDVVTVDSSTLAPAQPPSGPVVDLAASMTSSDRPACQHRPPSKAGGEQRPQNPKPRPPLARRKRKEERGPTRGAR